MSMLDLLEKIGAYTVYHPSYTAALDTVAKELAKKGKEIDEDSWWNDVNNGPRKPSEGKSVSLHLKLKGIEGKKDKFVHVQVYNRGNDVGNNYELNFYTD